MKIGADGMTTKLISDNLIYIVIKKLIIEIYFQEESIQKISNMLIENKVDKNSRKVVDNTFADEFSIKEVTDNFLEINLKENIKDLSDINRFWVIICKEIYEEILSTIISGLFEDIVKEEEIHQSALNIVSNYIITNSCHSQIQKYSHQIMENESLDLKRSKYISSCTLNSVILLEIHKIYENIFAETVIENIQNSIFASMQEISFGNLFIPQNITIHLFEHNVRDIILKIIESDIYTKKQQEDISMIAQNICQKSIEEYLKALTKEIIIQQAKNEERFLYDSSKSSNDFINDAINSKLRLISNELIQEEGIIHEEQNDILEAKIHKFIKDIASILVISRKQKLKTNNKITEDILTEYTSYLRIF